MKKLKIFVILFFVISFALVLAFDLEYFFSFEYINEQKDLFLGFTEANFLLSIILFSSFYFAFTSMALPGAIVLSLLGGFLFGNILGTLLIVFSATLGATVTTLVTRYLFREYIRAKCIPKVESVCNLFEKHGISYLFFLRMVPIFPFFAVNIAMGFVKLPALKYMLVSFFGILPISFLYANVGSQISDLNEFRDIFSPILILSLVILALVPIVFKYLFNRFYKI